VSIIEQFFADVDAHWKPDGAERIRLRLIGSCALMLQADYVRGTKDSDVLETHQLAGDTGQKLLALAGSDTAMHRRHRLYIDIVPSGLPFLPQLPKWHPLAAANASLKHLYLEALDVLDVVVSKLKRFNANDVSDIEAMVERGLVPHGALLDRFKDPVDWYVMDARASELPNYIRNLTRVERDLPGAGESDIELPGWI